MTESFGKKREARREGRLAPVITLRRLLFSHVIKKRLSLYQSSMAPKGTRAAPVASRITISHEIYCPRVIPTITVVGILYFFTTLKALWPVYGFLSPLIILVLFMGFLFSTHFIPHIPGLC